MKGLLSKIEYIVIGIFAIIFLMWAISKCSSHKEQAQGEAAVEAKEDSLANAAKKNVVSPITPAATPATAVADTAKVSPPPASPSDKPQEQQGSKLYITIDKLKIRKTPGLKGELLGELKLFDEVYYQDEVTDSTYEVNLGKEVANEPYVKVKTKRGTVGWVYGAGVHYVKKKRSGVIE